MRKRNFLLIELMIAIALVALLAIPILSVPIMVANKEIDLLYEAELEHHADLTYLTLRPTAEWKNLPVHLKNAEYKSLSEKTISVAGLGKRTYSVKYRMCRKNAKVKDETAYSTLWTQILFDHPKKAQKKYDYKLHIRNSDKEIVANLKANEKVNDVQDSSETRNNL